MGYLYLHRAIFFADLDYLLQLQLHLLGLQKSVKDALDPQGFLNPRKIFIEKELELQHE